MSYGHCVLIAHSDLVAGVAVARYAAGTLPSLGSARAAVQRKERGLMQAIEELHRLAPLQKQRSQKVQAVMQELFTFTFTLIYFKQAKPT